MSRKLNQWKYAKFKAFIYNKTQILFAFYISYIYIGTCHISASTCDITSYFGGIEQRTHSFGRRCHCLNMESKNFAKGRAKLLVVCNIDERVDTAMHRDKNYGEVEEWSWEVDWCAKEKSEIIPLVHRPAKEKSYGDHYNSLGQIALRSLASIS